MARLLVHRLLKYGAPDVLIWASVFFLWKEYYKVVDPPPLAWTFAFICTAFAGIAFYFTYHYLVPVIWKKGNSWRFIAAIVFTLAILAAFRSASIYIAFETRFPGHGYWRFFNSITASAFHIGYAITVAMLLRLFVDRYEMQKKLDAVARDKLQTELNYLKSQVNPHFMFNILNSIYFLIEESPGKAADALLKLSGVMKYQLYECNRDMIHLSHEIENIMNYIALERMRIEEAVQVDFRSTVSNTAQQLPPFLLMPVIENTFKHVSQEADRKNEIRISLSQRKEWIHLVTRNTVQGSAAYDSKGLGLKNLKRRLELLYPERHALSTTTADGNFEISLEIKLQ